MHWEMATPSSNFFWSFNADVVNVFTTMCSNLESKEWMINSRLCHFSCTLPTYRVLKKGLKLRGSCFECKKFRVGMNVKSCFTRKCPVSMRISSYFECEASKSYFVQSLFLCVLIKSISPPAMGPFYLWSLQWSLGTLLKYLNSDPKEIESLKM